MIYFRAGKKITVVAHLDGKRPELGLAVLVGVNSRDREAFLGVAGAGGHWE